MEFNISDDNAIASNADNAIASNAYNFTEHLATGVDVRTGMYTISIKLGDFLSHKTTGLSLPISLLYSASSARDVGFGRGWDISISRFDKNRNALYLSTGQSFELEWNSEKNEYDIPYRKLKDIRVFYVDETRQVKVMYKDGRCDYISWDDGVVTRSISPSGLAVYYDYANYNFERALWRVYDNAGRELSIDWSDSYSTKITHSLNDDVIQRIELNKLGSGASMRLVSALLPGLASPLNIRYRYVSESGYDLIEEVTHPSGLIEQMSYLDRGHPLPNGAPLSHVPCIAQYTQLSGEHQPTKSVNYEYSDRNYLGFGSDMAWVAGGDTLFQARKDYKYTVSESVNNSKVTLYQYNKYHLLDNVTYMDSGVIYKEEAYDYYANLDEGIEGQPATYTLLREQTTTHHSNGTSRAFTNQYEYDDFGNLILERAVDGACIVRTFYPVEGEGEDCPPQSSGMVSLLKSEEFVPSTTTHAETSRKTTMTYRSLTKLNNEPGDFIVLKSSFDENTSTDFSYYENSGDHLTYGRVKAQVLSINGFNTTSEYAYSFSTNELETTTTVKLHDGIELSSSEVSSYVHGKTTEVIGPDGVVEQIEYDLAGRQTKLVTAVGLPEQTDMTWIYSVGAGNNAVTETDCQGNVKITRFDNAGKVVFIEMAAVGMQPRVVQSCEYDAMGLLVSQTDTDWFNDDHIDVTTRYFYDETGQINEIVHADGRRETINQNPVSLTSEYCLSGLMSEKTVFDLSGREVRRETRDSKGGVIATTDYLYDGYGNQTEIADTEGRRTYFKYDDLDRPVEVTRHIDGQSIQETMTYPSFTDADSVESVSINSTRMGIRHYDGLLRVTEEVAANARRFFSYTGSFQLPSQQVTPAGDIIETAYNAPLMVPVSRRVQGEMAETLLYNHDSVTGGLTSHINAICDHQFEYDSMGRIISETISLNNGDAKTANYTYSMAGRMLTRQDFIGNLTEWEYDEFLRPWRCSYKPSNGNEIITTIFFDEFSRPCRYVSVEGGQETVVVIDMSDIGLELARTISVNGENVYASMLTYNENQQVESRVIHDGSGETTEQYEYDDLSRLIAYRCNGAALPGDGYGNKIIEQLFTHDIYGNIVSCTSTFSSGQSNLSQFSYFPDNPVRLERVSNSHPSYPRETVFQYDDAGNVLNDELGLSYFYDAFGRLASVNSTDNNSSLYAYDANGTLVSQTVDSQPIYFYYHDTSLVNEVADNAEACYHHASPGLIKRTAMLGQTIQHQQLYCNSQGGVIATITDNGNEITCESHAYTPYGVKTDEENN
ncbi:TPA: RHS repeat protein [Vibrio cholerae]|nr:RHS repeat protein [Vibrio cholerae]